MIADPAIAGLLIWEAGVAPHSGVAFISDSGVSRRISFAMNLDAPPIAQQELIRLKANGERIRIEIKISEPHMLTDGPWRTPVVIRGVDDRVKDIFGETSFQSLLLAMRFAHARLKSVLSEGDQLVYCDGTPFELDPFFRGE